MGADANPVVLVGVLAFGLGLLAIEYVRQEKNPRTDADRKRERPVRQGLMYSQLVSCVLFGVLLLGVAVIGLVEGRPVVFGAGLLGSAGAAASVYYIYKTAQRHD